MATTTIKFNEEFIQKISSLAKLEFRSVPKQIEYLVQIGLIAKDNPKLGYDEIKSILLGKQQIEIGETIKYERSTKSKRNN